MALDCQLETEYSEDEWRAFVRCAREGMESGERLHHEFEAKLQQHRLPAREAERAINSRACLAVYKHRGTGRLGLWDERSGLFVIGTVPEGLILNAYRLEVRDPVAYIESLEEMRWLKKP